MDEEKVSHDNTQPYSQHKEEPANWTDMVNRLMTARLDFILLRKNTVQG